MAPKPQEEQMPTQSDHQSDSNSEATSCNQSGPKPAPVAAGLSKLREPPREKKKKKNSMWAKVFSDDDVVTLLKRLAVFWANGKKNKWTEFYRFVKDDLSKEFTKIQVSEKIRSLNDKFKRSRKKNVRVDLLDPHELAVFELSTALWGGNKEMGENDGIKKRKRVNKGDEPNTMITEEAANTKHGEANKKTRKKKRKHVDEKQKQKNEIKLDDFQSAYPHLYESFQMPGRFKVSIAECVLIGRENAEELEQKWKELNAEQHRLELKKLALTTPKQ